MLTSLAPLFSETTFEVRTALFYPTSNRFREIYDPSACYEVEASTTLNSYSSGWANFDWYSRHGKTEQYNLSTKIQMNTISFGIKFPYQLTSVATPYLGIGPTFSKIHLENKSVCPNEGTEKTTKWAYGVVLKSGVNFLMSEYIFGDLFVDYSYQPAQFQKNTDTGGIKAGIGFGFIF